MSPPLPRWVRLVLQLLVAATALALASADGSSSSSSSNVWVVLVGTSRNWLNYRDNANTLALYRSVRSLGVPDSHILLLLSDHIACSARNPHMGAVYHTATHGRNLYGEHVEVDYRGAEVTVDSFLRLLTGRHDSSLPRSKRLLSDASSRILIYLTGHGGDKFLKFQDKEELQAQDLADALHNMHKQGRYQSILLMVDTCQAQTLCSEVYSPNIVSVASSAKGEMSYSHHPDAELGVSLVDRFTFHTLEFLKHTHVRSQTSLLSLFSSYDPSFLLSTPGYTTHNYSWDIDKVPLTAYLASVMAVRPISTAYPMHPISTAYPMQAGGQSQGASSGRMDRCREYGVQKQDGGRGTAIREADDEDSPERVDACYSNAFDSSYGSDSLALSGPRSWVGALLSLQCKPIEAAQWIVTAAVAVTFMAVWLSSLHNE